MTKEELKNYRHLIKEIAKLEKDIAQLCKRQAKIPIVKDKVQSSMKDFPYTQTHVTVDAREPLANSTIEILLSKKEARLRKVQLQRIEIEEFIDRIEDSWARRVIEAVYVDGKSQIQAALDLNVNQATISRIIDKILKDA